MANVHSATPATRPTPHAIPALAQRSAPFRLQGLRQRIGPGVGALVQDAQQVKPALAHQPLAWNTGAVRVKPHRGVQPRHAPINKGAAWRVAWVAVAKPGDTPVLVEPLNHSHMAGVALGSLLRLGHENGGDGVQWFIVNANGPTPCWCAGRLMFPLSTQHKPHDSFFSTRPLPHRAR